MQGFIQRLKIVRIDKKRTVEVNQRDLPVCKKPAVRFPRLLPRNRSELYFLKVTKPRSRIFLTAVVFPLSKTGHQRDRYGFIAH